MFSATRLQTATYLLGVCPFSIAFLVFLNSSVSFVITDLIGKKDGVGDAVGNLGFADELVALIACPLWGLLSDRVGLRLVCVCGYLIIGLALALFVQAKDVYPQLLLARLFFSIGGAAASTMVTAVLPAVAASASTSVVADTPQDDRLDQAVVGNGHVSSPSIESEVTITPARFVSRQSSPKKPEAISSSHADVASSTSRVAGFVGMFTGCGALLALGVFLPLPAKFQYAGVNEKDALRDSFYIVAAVALVLAIWCFFGLRRLESAEEGHNANLPAENNQKGTSRVFTSLESMLYSLRTAVLAGFHSTDIGVGYIGGFVARASSVGISLFIPLLVNAMFLSSGLCDAKDGSGSPAGLPDIKRKCPRAYVVAAELTGVTETVALIFAPVFGYWAARSSQRQLPLLAASLAGVVGYSVFANEFDPDDTKTSKRIGAFAAAALIGISQIGAIVCSLGTLSKGVLMAASQQSSLPAANGGHAQNSDEAQPLLAKPASHANQPLSTLKGAVAGVYSLYGGAAILILTKVGGLLFDKVSLAAPFYIMAIFNAILAIACVVLSVWHAPQQTSSPPDTR